MRVLIDYRPALRERSGVGESTHQLARALIEAFPPGAPDQPLELTIFSSSWKDRLSLPPEMAAAAAIDRRIPVSVLNLAWHRLEWPTAETVTGRTFDVVHSPHPLLLPARQAAQVVTIHDLHFLDRPERTSAEIRRDYPALVRDHARRADAVLTPSRFTASEIERRLDVAPDRITVCPHGAPGWQPRTSRPADGYILFLGTLEPRKNIAGLLDAYESLIRQRPTAPGTSAAPRRVPELVLAGKATDESGPWLDRIARPPLAGRVRHIGYVDPSERRSLYAGARLLAQPSFDEGFGLPVLEAMTIGVPVVASNRGALPEVLGDAGLQVDPDQPAALASAIGRLLDDDGYADACAAKGLDRARAFTWPSTAHLVYDAYRRAIERRRARREGGR